MLYHPPSDDEIEYYLYIHRIQPPLTNIQHNTKFGIVDLIWGLETEKLFA